MFLENKKLQKIIEDLKISQEARLNQQAEMFQTLMRKNETVLKQKLETVSKMNKILNKNVQRKKNNITNLKSAFKFLKNRNILENDAVFKLKNEYGNLLLPLLKNEKRNKDIISPRGRRYSEEVKRFAITMHYYSPKAYEYCRLACVCSLSYLLPHTHASIPVNKNIFISTLTN